MYSIDKSLKGAIGFAFGKTSKTVSLNGSDQKFIKDGKEITIPAATQEDLEHLFGLGVKGINKDVKKIETK